MGKSLLFTGLFLTLSAWGQNSELLLREQLSKQAQDKRLKESVELIQQGLDVINVPAENCPPSPPVMSAPPQQRYILVGVSGFGTGEDGEGQPSGAHDNLPILANVAETYRLTHGGPSEKLDEVMANFQCQAGHQKAENLGLIIMANSWGAGKATKLAKRYAEECGQEVELFVMVDGINKPIPTSFSKTPKARRCINYYQRSSTLKGNEIKGCENHDLSYQCQSGGLAHCHIEVEWAGTGLGADEISRTVKGY